MPKLIKPSVKAQPIRLYICSPLAPYTISDERPARRSFRCPFGSKKVTFKANLKLAIGYAKAIWLASNGHFWPILPHVQFPYITEKQDSDPKIRNLSFSYLKSFFENKMIDRILVVGDYISTGMMSEILWAYSLGIPVLYIHYADLMDEDFLPSRLVTSSPVKLKWLLDMTYQSAEAKKLARAFKE